MKNELRTLLSNVSYYRAGEGQMYLRETSRRMKAEEALHTFVGKYTQEQIKEMWPLDKEGYFESYLVNPTMDIWSKCRDGGYHVEEHTVQA